jgi:ABC-type branched-subunit amino acid transport system substrate-binding protein
MQPMGSAYGGMAPMAPADGAGLPAVPGALGGAVVRALLPGTSLKGGRYHILQRLHAADAFHSQGNEPPLLIATDQELGSERVLVQELSFPMGTRPVDAEQWRRNVARHVQDIAESHCIPRLLDAFGEQGRHFLVYELPSGEFLLDRLQRVRGALDEKQAIAYTLQLLDVLDVFEHQRPPFLHGNICPANILLRPSGQVVLVGFSPMLLLYPEGRVEHGMAGGALGYAAPEQARGQANTRSDLYALCAVLHHMVTGTAPAPRANAMHPPARHLNPNVSLELEELIGRGLRLSSTQRFQTAQEMRTALEDLSHKRLTHVTEDLLFDDDERAARLAPVRDARGRLVLARQRPLQNPLVLITAIVALIVLVGGGVLYAALPHTNAGAAIGPTPTPNGIAQLYQDKGIGLSGGEYIFDTGLANNALKQKGAQALATGDLHTAYQSFKSAMALVQTDAEAAIYTEDVRILLAKDPYVTVVAAVSYGDADEAHDMLQGVFLAQQRINEENPLPGHMQLRVLVLNSGATDDGATLASNVLLQEIQLGNAQHLIGIVGWPESAETRLAISALAPSGLAIVSPTATQDNLGGHANFFPLVPSDSQQAAELATAVATQLNGQHVLVLKKANDDVSAAETTSFLQSLASYPNVTAQTTTFTDTSRFSQIVGQAQSQGASLIFLACGNENCDSEALSLSQAINQQTWYTPPPHIITTHQAYTPSLLGVAGDDTSQFVRTNPALLSNIYVTKLTDLNEWTALNLPDVVHPTLPYDYEAQYGVTTDDFGLPAPDDGAILGYDAVRLLVRAATPDTHMNGNKIAYATPTQIRVRLLQYDHNHPFLGVGGAITFTQTGSEPVKSLVIAGFQPEMAGTPAANRPVAASTIIAVTGGNQMFCGTTCNPS